MTDHVPSSTDSNEGAPIDASAMAAYEAWVSLAEGRSRKSISAKTARTYLSTWQRWVMWMSQYGSWRDAQDHHVTAYLRQLGQSSTRRNKGSLPAVGGASSVTQHRYWRVLRDVYMHAVLTGKCTHNPCMDAVEVPRNEIMDSMILPSWALLKLEQMVQLQSSGRDPKKWRALRDDAILVMFLHTAIKTGELVQLRADQITVVTSGRHSEHLVVHVDGARKFQNRHIPITDKQAIAIIGRWMLVREAMPSATQFLFFGAKTRVQDGQKKCINLTPKSVFLLVSKWVQSSLGDGAFESGLAHVGAEAVRNSVIARWIEQGTEIEDCMKRAGVAEPRAVVRLNRQPA